jgi:hypothetical protein
MKLHSNFRTRGTAIDGRLCLRPLAACLAATLCSGASATDNHAHGQALVAAIRGNRVAHFAHSSAATSSVTHVVSTCDDPQPLPPNCEESIDNGVHTVQTVRLGFLCAQNGDTIDLSKLQCSKITLSETLVAREVNLALVGPGQEKLTIDAGGMFRAIAHYTLAGHGLYINYLTIANGRYAISPNVLSDGLAYGGCIFSTGYVNVNFSTVSSCSTSSAVRTAGGAIFSPNRVSLYHSTVTGSTAQNSSNGSAKGGGIRAYLVELAQSTVSGNTASAVGAAEGGGINANVFYANRSTISGNAAKRAAGIWAGSVHLSSSTVSGNQTPSTGVIGGIYATQLAQVFSSTIAGNTSGGTIAAGLYVAFPRASDTLVDNTIIADNKASGVELDIGTTDGKAIPGSSNLINAHQAQTFLPADTLVGDPRLGPLRDNGGPTQTRDLLPGSSAIDKGSNGFGIHFDQRGVPRVEGSEADIGAFESDRIFSDAFNP